jgi:Ca2+-binding RTX toxin-like protein
MLAGRSGNDVLRGGAGADRLQGDSGADRFDFDTISDSGLGRAADLILDFAHAQGDRIDLSDIDAIAGVAGNQAFSATLIAGLGTAFTAAGQLRIGYDGAANQTIPGQHRR